MSEREKAARKRLGSREWDGLAAMIAGYADEAKLVARLDFHEELEPAAAALEGLERILNRLCPAPEPLPAAQSRWLTLLWGSCFGELLRALHGGEWTMSLYPGSDFSVPTLEIRGSRPHPLVVYPMMKVHRRLTLGAAESLPAFYAVLAARLTGPPAAAP